MSDIRYKKKSKKKVKSKNYKTKRGDTAKHGSSINKINIRIVSPMEGKSSTPAVHPDTQALNEQTRLHLAAVQAIVLDNHRPQPSMPPAPIRVPVRVPLESNRIRLDVNSPSSRASSRSTSVVASPSAIGLHDILRSPSVEPQPPINIRERIRNNSVAPLEPLDVSATFPTHTPRGTRRLFYHPTRQQPIVQGTERFNDFWRTNEIAGIDPPLVPMSPYRSRLETHGR